jgi:UDP-3-O-[3-hydroxymyristoyl] glucosamine N-acyltransferase
MAGDPRFFTRCGPFTVAELAAAAQGEPPADGSARRFTGLATLELAGPDEVSFLDNRRYADALSATRAGCVMVHPEMLARVPPGCLPIGWARVAALFHPLPPLAPGIHPAAVVDPAATIDPTAEIGPLAVVDAGAEIGPRCRIGVGAWIGAGVVLGPDCRIGAHASLSHALVGARVYIYTGARIGQDGFGFETTPAGFLTVPQLGRVILEDDVEVGANSTIDRGSIGDTVIGAGSRLDNLVQIGHNVRLGRCCVIVSQAGISGSTVLEDFVMAGGQAGITGHLRLGKGAKIGAQAGVMADVPAGAAVLGSPALPIKEFFRQVTVLKRLVAQRRSQMGKGAPSGEVDSD